MYESYWQLDQKPFDNTADPRFYYPGESHQAALLKIRYAIENHRGGALLAGPSGCGKTLVANTLGEKLGEQLSPRIHVVFPQMNTPELLTYLADELDGSRSQQTLGVQASIERIEAFLADNTQQGRHAVVIVDEAQLIDDARTFEALRLLQNFQPGGQPGLTLLLIGQTGLLPIIDRIPQLEERLAVKCLLRPFTLKETADYVAHRLRTAGAMRMIFDREAMPTLHRLTQGVARKINRLCDLALLIGYAEEQVTLNASHLEAVAEELVAVAAD